MKGTEFLDSPFFEPRHRALAERLYRAIRALRIDEGTSDIHKLVIAASLLEAA